MNASSSSCALIAIVATGCAQWTSVPTYGPRTEIARRLVGAPQVEEVSSSSVEGGFATAGESYAGRHYQSGYQLGGLSGSHESSKRTHCIQQAQIDYTEPVTYEPRVANRSWDVVGSVATGLAGLSIIGVAGASYSVAQDSYQSDLRFYQMDPSFFPKPTEPSPPTLAYAIGGAAIVGAAAWLVYSLTSLPRGPKPALEPQTHAWTETTFVEALGCGLVPGDRPAMP